MNIPKTEKNLKVHLITEVGDLKQKYLLIKKAPSFLLIKRIKNHFIIKKEQNPKKREKMRLFKVRMYGITK